MGLGSGGNPRSVENAQEGTEVRQRGPLLLSPPTAQSSGSPGGAGLTRRSVKGAVREVVQSSNVDVQAEAQGLSPFPTGTQGLSYELKG